MRILYDSRQLKYKTPFGVLTPDEDCRISVYLPLVLHTVSAQLVMLSENGQELFRTELKKTAPEGDYEPFSCTFSLKETGLYFYRFQITTPNESFRLFKQQENTNMESGDLWQISCVSTAFPVPEALQGALMYQIFPDRFFRQGSCDLTEKLQPYWLHENLSDMPEYRPNEKGETENCDFFGGNLQGVIQKLPYLQSLGVKILYLNPIFMAWSNHRYDTYDYKRIDPMLGTEEDFSALCREAHERGMKIVLDGVFSHVGSRSVYFQSAVSDENSPYRQWFQFEHYPDKYKCWWDIKTLPCIDKLCPSYMDSIIEDEDSVVAKWLKLGADGFRLDVVDELPDAFVLALRKKMRSLDPEAILIGEVWEDASNKIAYDVRRRYFVDAELDSVMNYPWKNAIFDYVSGKDDGTNLSNSILTLAENYPPQVLQSVMNILSTHDTPRMLTQFADERDASREELAKRTFSDETLLQAKKKFRLAVFLQFMLPGMPCIYYGDEAGMSGYRDPFNRCFFPWGNEDRELQEYYRTLSRFRELPALRRGTVCVSSAGEGRIAFSRTFEGQTVRIFCNQSGKPWQLAGGQLLYGENLQSVSKTQVTLLPNGFCAVTA